MDPTAGRLDDFQIKTLDTHHAYQIKWSADGGQMSWGDLRTIIAELVHDRRRIADANLSHRVIGHLYTNLVASNSRLVSVQKGETGASLARFVQEVLGPTTRGLYESASSLDAKWRPVWTELAESCELNEETLLQELAHIRLDLGEHLPNDPQREHESDSGRYERDLNEIFNVLIRVVVDPDRVVWLDKRDLLGRLGPEWQQRLAITTSHTFPGPRTYRPIEQTVTKVDGILDSTETGYVALVGPPGSGKSTLISQSIQGRKDVVARYYCYVPDDLDIGGRRSRAETFLHYLVLTLERNRVPSPDRRTPPSLDIQDLTRRLEMSLTELSERFLNEGEKSVVIVDGLDHVDRQIELSGSLLRYLPTHLPTGVVFLLGSQTIAVLPEPIRSQLETTSAHVEIGRFGIGDVAAIAAERGYETRVNHLWRLSAGHPLTLSYFLNLLDQSSADERGTVLENHPRVEDDVLSLYSRLWDPLESDDEMVELLGLISRIRGPIDLEWLESQGQPPGLLRRFRRLLGHLFMKQGNKLRFFHDSFRTFLRERTVSEDGSPNEAIDRRYHARLAAMCNAAPSDSLPAWDALFHFSSAGDGASVLALATPDFFRRQFLNLRPHSEIVEDIQLAGRSLAVEKDPHAFVRLVIASSEIHQRDSYMPDRRRFLGLLVESGHADLAVEQALAFHDDHSDPDPRQIHLDLAVDLWESGLVGEARRVFDANEPWELLRASSTTETHLRSPYQLLYSWARAAALLQGPQVVAAQAERQQMPAPAWGDEDQAARTSAARAWMLGAASGVLLTHGLVEAGLELANEIDIDSTSGRKAYIQIAAGAARIGDLRALNEVSEWDPRSVPDESRVIAGQVFFKADRAKAASNWVEGLTQPSSPSTPTFDDAWELQMPRYRFNRLRAALGDIEALENAVHGVPTGSWWVDVYVGRAVVGIAQLEGRVWSMDASLDPDTFIAAGTNLGRQLTAAANSSKSASYIVNQIRCHGWAQLLRIASDHSRDSATAIWRAVTASWDENPESRLAGRHEILNAAVEAVGIPRRDVEQRALAFRQEVGRASTGSVASELHLDAAEALVTAGLASEAWDTLRDATLETLGVWHRKDYQLNHWISLLEPRLAGPEGRDLARWLAGTLIGVSEEADGSQAREAAQELVAGEARRGRPFLGWTIGEWLETRAEILLWDERLSAFLEGTVNRSDDHLWWILLGQQLTRVGPPLSQPTLDEAATQAIQTNRQSWLRDKLVRLLQVVAADAHPGDRGAWYSTVNTISEAQSLDIDMSGYREPQTRAITASEQGTSPSQDWGAEEDVYHESITSPEALFQELAATDLSELSYRWASTVERVAPMMTIDEVGRAAELLGSDHDHGAAIFLTLARRALELEVQDMAEGLARESLSYARPRHWDRRWSDAPILGSLRILRELNLRDVVDLAFELLARHCSSDRHILGALDYDLESILPLLGGAVDEEVASEVEAYLHVLLSEPVDIPDLPREEPTDGSPFKLPFLGILRYPQRWATTLTQQSWLAAVEAGAKPLINEMGPLLGNDTPTVQLTALSIIETLQHLGSVSQLDEPLIGAIRAVADSPNLQLRESAKRILSNQGEELSDRAPLPLPSVYRLSSSESSGPRVHPSAQPMGRDDLAKMLVHLEKELVPLSERSDIDHGILAARVAQYAREVAGEHVDDMRLQKPYDPLGWEYIKPSTQAIEEALGKVAAELVDARRLPSAAAISLTTGPGYDPVLISSQPLQRPDEIAHLPETETTYIKEEDWLAGTDGSETRLATRWNDDWFVLAEKTEIRLLMDSIPSEKREQALVIDPNAVIGTTFYFTLQGRGLAGLSRMPVLDPSRPVLHHWDPRYVGPSEWLSLHPKLAAACGWSPDPTATIGWLDDEGPVCRSVWWRDGCLSSTRRDSLEVGEGWLLAVHERGVRALGREAGAPLTIHTRVTRDFRTRGKPERSSAGVRAVGGL